MSNPTLGVPEDVTEYFEDSESIQRKTRKLAKWLKKSKHSVFYTGAGISTSASIPDFRGPQGVWTLRDQGKKAKCEITMEQAQPTLCHMSLVALQDNSMMKYLVSQNVDGLHRRSGIRKNTLSELHGNCFIEFCDTCKHEYLRTFDVHRHISQEIKRTNRHSTGRRCTQPNCPGGLMDSIIHFSETLPIEALRLADEHSRQSDLAVVLGTSLRVSPACKLPKYAKRAGAKLVIVNLQPTPLDDICDLRIYGKTDEVMKLVMEHLGVAIPTFQPSVPISVGCQATKLEKRSIGDSKDQYNWELSILPADGIDPSAIIKQVTVKLHPTFEPNTVVLSSAPFKINRIGWGTFQVGLTFEFTDKRFQPATIQHELVFSEELSESIYHLPLN